MKTINVLIVLSAATLFVASGCGKSNQTPQAPTFNNVTVDIPKLTQAFAEASPELKALATQAGFSVRYGKYEDSLMALDKLVNDANVNEAQKKVVNEVIEQVKKLANAAPAAAAPAQ
jgi:hypothetical protein